MLIQRNWSLVLFSCVALCAAADEVAIFTYPVADAMVVAEAKISKDQAAQIAQQETGGRVLSVITQEQKNAPVHRVKILVDGRVRIIRVHGETGQIANK